MYTTETRTFPKGIKEIRVFDDNISLRFTSRDRTGYITLNNATGKFDIIPGIGVDAPVTSVNTMTGDVVITAADLNAALVGHTHLKADITDFIHTHTKADISDFGHTHTKSQITDLGAILPEAPLDGKQYARKNANWEEVTSTAPSTGTNLSITRTSSSVVVLSDTGSDASIPSATTSLAGVMTSSDKLKVDSAVQNINAVDGGISLVHTRTGDTCNIKSIQAGANVTLTEYAGVITVSSTGSGSNSMLLGNIEFYIDNISELVNSMNTVPSNLNGFRVFLRMRKNTTLTYNNSYDFSRFRNGVIRIEGAIDSSASIYSTTSTFIIEDFITIFTKNSNVSIELSNLIIKLTGNNTYGIDLVNAQSFEADFIYIEYLAALSNHKHFLRWNSRGEVIIRSSTIKLTTQPLVSTLVYVKGEHTPIIRLDSVHTADTNLLRYLVYGSTASLLNSLGFANIDPAVNAIAQDVAYGKFTIL